MDLILAPLQYAFFTRALEVGSLLGLTCGVLGCFVVLRGMAFVGDALAHSVLPGVVIAALVGFPIFGGALVAGLLVSLAISALSGTRQVKDDTAIGIVFTGAFALGIVLISRAKGVMRDLSHLLFGNILGVAPSDVVLMATLVPLILLVVVGGYRAFVTLSFDPVHARVTGLPVVVLHGIMMLLLSLS